jgi:hypothetical protein
MRGTWSRWAGVIAGIVLLAGCASSSSVEENTAQNVPAGAAATTFQIEVQNTLDSSIGVSVDPGSGTLVSLGDVPAGETRTFTITDPPNMNVSIVARAQGGTDDIRKSVSLKSGELVRVTIE